MSEEKGMHMNIETLLNDPNVMEAIDNESRAAKDRKRYQPPLCKVFSSKYTELEKADEFVFDIDIESKKALPNIIDNKVERIIGLTDVENDQKKNYEKVYNIGLVFSGGPAPGGHNVIAGIYDAAQKANPLSRIFGFLMGPDGVIEGEYIEITRELVDRYKNIGGFTMIRTGRTKIDTPDKMKKAKESCIRLKLNALVIIGGDDSNTNAAFLAQELFDHGIQVIGVPKTIDGDIQVKDANGVILCPISFGFHSAARAFSESISNLCTDGSSDVKYWHVCKVMGRVASHLGLEAALQTHANIALIGEEMTDYVDHDRLGAAKQKGVTDYTAYGMTLRHLSRIICDGIIRRAAYGKVHGVMIIPEGILEFINEIQIFIIKLNTIIADYNRTHDKDFHLSFPMLEEKLDYLRRLARLSREDNTFSIWSTRDDDLFNDIPAFFQEGLLMERDSHGNFPFSLVKTEDVLMGLVKDYLNIQKEKGLFKVGIMRSWYKKTMEEGGLDPDGYGPVLFKNYDKDSDCDFDCEFLMVKETIMSLKTLSQHMIEGGVLENESKIPPAVAKVYKKSVPSFSTRHHFYGYDGRGSNPTKFDADYTYNLGYTAFSLIVNGSTGQMAAIKNLELDFTDWEPIGIPIAPLMHLEERNGKLTLVLEKSIVDVESNAFRVFQKMRETWLAADPGKDHFRKPGPNILGIGSEEAKPLILELNGIGKKI